MKVFEVITEHCADDSRLDIGWTCREMLRWFDKLGSTSDYASKSRDRTHEKPWAEVKGDIWWRTELDDEKERRAK